MTFTTTIELKGKRSGMNARREPVAPPPARLRKFLQRLMAAMVLSLLGSVPFEAEAQSNDVFDSFFRFTEVEHKPFFEGTNGDLVDPFTGTVRIVQEDLVLPGVAGHDLRVVRAYSSKLWGRTDLLTSSSPLLVENENSALGYGWTFHFGRLRNPNASGIVDICSGDLPIFEAPDGSNHVFYPSASEPGAWISKDYWRLELNCSYLAGAGACVWSNAGTRYEFDPANQGYYGTVPVWPAKAIVDTFGNQITLDYMSPGQYPNVVNVPPVASIVDTYGRTVTFDYWTYTDGDGVRLKSMTANGKVYSYGYTLPAAGSTAGPGKFPIPDRRFLTSVTPPAGPGFAFTYGFTRTVEQNQYALASITYPSGATASYTYAKWNIFAGSTTIPLPLVQQRTVTGRGLVPGTWTYAYQALPPGSTTGTDRETGASTNFNVTTVTRPDGKKDTFSFFGFGAVVDLAPNGGLTYAVGLTREMTRGDGAEIEQLNWTPLPAISNVIFSAPNYAGDTGCPAIVGLHLQDGAVYPAAMEFRGIYRDPKSTSAMTAKFETTYGPFDAYGQAETIVETGVQADAMLQVDEAGHSFPVPLQFGGTKTRTTTSTYFSKPRLGTGPTLNILRGRPLSQTVAEGNETMASSWTYLGPNFARDSETVSGITTNFSHHLTAAEGVGNLKTVTNALGQVLNLSGYGAGSSCQAASGCGIPTVLDLNGLYSVRRTASWEGWVLTETNGRNYTTSYTYDDIGRPSTVTPPLPLKNASTTITWATDNSWRTLVRGLYTKTSTLDGLGRTIKTSDSAGTATSARFDAMGQRWFTSYPFAPLATDEVGSKLDLDAIGRPVMVSRAWRPSYASYAPDITNSFSSNCVKTKLNTVTAQVGAYYRNPETTRCYTAFGSPAEQRLSSLADPMGSIWQFGSSVSGKLESVLAPLVQGDRSNFYDPVTQLLSTELTAESGTNTFTYNAIGQVSTRRDALGVIQTYGYADPLSRWTSLAYTGAGSVGGDDVSRSYDNSNNITDVSSPNGGAYHYTFDELNRVTSQTWSFGPQTYTTTFGFDTQGCLISVVYTTGDSLVLTCDTANRTTSITLNGAVIVTDVTYHPGGQVKTMKYGDQPGRVTTTVLDDLQRAKTITAPGVIGLNYTYDMADNVLTHSDSEAAGSGRSFTYDLMDRLIVAQGPNWWGTAVYDYDELGNRTLKSDSSTTVNSYDAKNRLDAVWVSGGEKYPSLTLTWDVAGRLSSSSDGASYRYDAMGRRVQKTASAQNTVYHHDTAGRVIAETDLGGLKQRIFIYLGNKLVTVDGCAAGAMPACAERQWYHTDALGSVVARTDASGAVVARLNYQPWGEQWSVAGDGGDRQYNGRVFDPGTGFHDYGARMYCPQIGRFISADSVMGSPGNPASLNRYSYVHNNPYKYVDPDGRMPFLAVTGLVGAVGGGIYGAVSSANSQEGFSWGAVGKGAAIGGVAGLTLGVGTSLALTGTVAASTAEVGAAGAALMGMGGAAAKQAEPALSRAGEALLRAEPAGSALKGDQVHRAATFMRDAAARSGRTFEITGGDGASRTLTQVGGKLNDVSGRYEYIVDGGGKLTHQMFVAGGAINGVPIKP